MFQDTYDEISDFIDAHTRDPRSFQKKLAKTISDEEILENLALKELIAPRRMGGFSNLIPAERRTSKMRDLISMVLNYEGSLPTIAGLPAHWGEQGPGPNPMSFAERQIEYSARSLILSEEGPIISDPYPPLIRDKLAWVASRVYNVRVVSHGFIVITVSRSAPTNYIVNGYSTLMSLMTEKESMDDLLRSGFDVFRTTNYTVKLHSTLTPSYRKDSSV